jgi:hypothetical protein
MRLLFIGDPHGRKEDLADLRQLFEYCSKISRDTGAIPVFLGDLKHHHGIVYAEVMDFYSRWFRKTDNWYAKPIVVKGNHDMVLGTQIHTLTPYMDYVDLVADEPMVRNGVVFVPYMEDLDALVKTCGLYSECGTLVFHATVDGALYENGFPARDGVDPRLFPQKHIVSGHIHRPGFIGKVHYVGAPRWLGVSDANTDRAIWVMDFDEKGNLLKRESYSTNGICRQIFHFSDTESNPLDPASLNTKSYNIVDIHGRGDWVESRSRIFEQMGCRIRSFKEQQVIGNVRESDGIDAAFVKFCAQFKPEYGTPIEILKEIVENRLHGC